MDWNTIGDITLRTVILAVMIVGILGLIIPILPGLVIIWLAGLVYGVLTGFTTAGWILFALMTLLMAVGSLVDNVIMGASARQKGASWLAIGVSMVLAVIGSILLPPFGGLILALLGLFALEFWRLRDWRKAFESARSMAFGCGWSAVARTLMGLLMVGLWILWAFLFI